jgi:hypothetical protein
VVTPRRSISSSGDDFYALDRGVLLAAAEAGSDEGGIAVPRSPANSDRVMLRRSIAKLQRYGFIDRWTAFLRSARKPEMHLEMLNSKTRDGRGLSEEPCSAMRSCDCTTESFTPPARRSDGISGCGAWRPWRTRRATTDTISGTGSYVFRPGMTISDWDACRMQ